MGCECEGARLQVCKHSSSPASAGNTGTHCLYLLTSCSPAPGTQMLRLRAHPSQPARLPPCSTAWTFARRMNAIPLRWDAASKAVFAPSSTELESCGCITTFPGVLCQLIQSHICPVRHAVGSSRSYCSRGLSCLYGRSHTLWNSGGFRCHKSPAPACPGSLPLPCIRCKSILNLRTGTACRSAIGEITAAPGTLLLLPTAHRHRFCGRLALFFWQQRQKEKKKKNLCENYLFGINSSESKPQQTLGINRITQNTVV